MHNGDAMVAKTHPDRSEANMVKKPIVFLALGLIILVALLMWLFSQTQTISSARPAVKDSTDQISMGAAAFEGADFGGLSLATMQSHALPWRLVAAALVLQEQTRTPQTSIDHTTLNRILAGFGFLPSADIVNRPSGVSQSKREMPLGFTYGDLAPIGGTKVRVANLGCAACHAGVSYFVDGRPRPDRAWLGMPNTSLDLEAYTATVFLALKTSLTDSQKLLATTDTLFPEMGFRERQSLRFVVLPLVRQRMVQLGDIARPLPFPNGVPGSTNGVAALKYSRQLPLAGHGAADAGIVSIPDLGDRIWRSSLLVDGSYAIPGGARQSAISAALIDDEHLNALAMITSFFTVPSMGVDPNEAITHYDDISSIFAFLDQGYRPQVFPGPVDRAMAADGRMIYADNCSQCHGTYDSNIQQPHLMEFPNWLGDVKSDDLRATLFSDELVASFENTIYAPVISVQRTGQYAAPPLTGVWASAPYLHNGSVPTLAQLLDPESRPRKFQLGGHALDFEKVGLRIDANGAYPENYVPFSTPVWFDTQEPGKSNGGHTFGAELSDEQKLQLIEYLKLL